MFEHRNITAESVNPLAKSFSEFAQYGVLVTAGHGTAKGEWSTMTASWAMAGYLWNRPMAALFIRPQRYTAEIADMEDYLTVSFLDWKDEKMLHALQVCGTVSSRDGKKAEAAGLTPIIHDDGIMGFEEAQLTVSCRKLYYSRFDSDLFLDPQVIIDCYPQKDFHYVYFCELRDAYIKK